MTKYQHISKSFVKNTCVAYPRYICNFQSAIFHDVCKYLIRYRNCLGNFLGLNTVCCWKALKNNACIDTEENEYLQFFYCESLGFSMNISSAALWHCGNNNVYGAVFQSSFISHGTSFQILTLWLMEMFAVVSLIIHGYC